MYINTNKLFLLLKFLCYKLPYRQVTPFERIINFDAGNATANLQQMIHTDGEKQEPQD